MRSITSTIVAALIGPALGIGPAAMTTHGIAQATTDSTALELEVQGGFTNVADKKVRAVLTRNAPNLVHMNLYGRQLPNGTVVHAPVDLHVTPGKRELVGDWRLAGGYFLATVRVVPLDDRRGLRISFDPGMDSVAADSVSYLLLGEYLAEDAPNPSSPLPPATPRPNTPPPLSGPEPASAPAGSPQAPPVAEVPSFKPLRRFDVRLDRLVEARGYPTRQVHAFVTVKNASATPQYITSGILKAVLTDADGVAQERNQVWRATSEPAALFASTPVVQPGAELKVRYVFTPDEGSKPATLALSEGDKRAEFSAGF